MSVMLDRIPLLPDGTTLPSAPYLVGVLLAAGAVAIALRRRPPRVTSRHVVALASWMAFGSSLHVLYVIDALPGAFRPLGGSPTVYLFVATLTGATWLGAEAIDRTRDRVPTTLAIVGAIPIPPIVAVAIVASGGIADHGLFWATVALLATVPLAGATWLLLIRRIPEVTVTGGVGALTVFGHVLDGVSTTIGVSQLGFGERTPLSRWILELGGVPALPVVGDGWVFLLVKLAVATGVVWLFSAHVREAPTEGYLLLGLVAAVGFGPGVHNLLLFTVAA